MSIFVLFNHLTNEIFPFTFYWPSENHAFLSAYLFPCYMAPFRHEGIADNFIDTYKIYKHTCKCLSFINIKYMRRYERCGPHVILRVIFVVIAMTCLSVWYRNIICTF